MQHAERLALQPQRAPIRDRVRLLHLDLDTVLARALGGAVGFGAGDQDRVDFAIMDAPGHFVDEGLRALAADSFVDQAGGLRAGVPGEGAGEVRVVAVRVGGAADGVLEDAHDGDCVDGGGDAGRAGIGEGGLRRLGHQGERRGGTRGAGLAVPLAERLADADQDRKITLGHDKTPSSRLPSGLTCR